MCPPPVKDITIPNKNHGHRHYFIVTDYFWSESVVETALTFDDGGNHKKSHPAAYRHTGTPQVWVPNCICDAGDKTIEWEYIITTE